LATELSREFGIDAELIKGDNGVFEVRVDGDLVFDKADTDCFPEPGEVSDLLR